MFEILRHLILKQDNSISESVLEKYLAQFDNWIRILDNKFKMDENYISANGSTKFNGLDYFCAGRNKFVYIAHFPIKRFIFDLIYKTYSILDNNIIQTAKEYERSIFCPIRNPLDIIVSNAFELENLLLWMYPDEINNKKFESIREQYGLTFLANLEWFESITRMVKYYNEAHLRFKTDTHWVKYENTINNPVPNIIKMGKLANINLDEKEAAQIWDKVGFKPITKWKTHYFKPGEGKWKKYFSHEHLRILIKNGWQNLLNDLGYQIDLSSYLQKMDENNISDMIINNERIENYACIRDACFSVQFGKEMQFQRKNIKVSSIKVGDHIVKCATNSDDFSHIFERLTDSNELLDNYFN